jgi:hypothetical protein
LHNQNILRSVGERELSAIADEALCRAPILRDQPGRQVHSFEAREPKAAQRAQSIPAPAKQFHDFGIAGPPSHTQFLQARNKFANFLIGCFKPQVRGFPRIERGCARSIPVQIVGLNFHL